MSRTKLIIAAILFLAVTGFKFLMPDAAGRVRDDLHDILERDTDFRSSMTALGVKLSGEDGLVYALGLRQDQTADGQAAEAMAADTEPQEIPQYTYRPLTLNRIRANFTADLGDVPTPTASEADSQSQAGEAQPVVSTEPEAVTTFLAAQSAFADYAVPANVSYDMPALDISYISPVSDMTSSGFGYRVHPLSGEVKFHYGTDFAAWTGTDILCFADGTVSFVGEDTGYGNYLVVSHANGCRTLYAHCSEILVSSGENVTAGQVIARVGATGQVTGPHLHFELMQNDVYLNPEYYVNYLG